MDKQLTFEEAMQKLEQINLQLQQSNTSLTKSIELYQQGLSLANYCKQQLLSATKKIEELNNTVSTLTTERDTSVENYNNAQAQISTLTNELETLKDYKNSVETQEKEQVIASYSELLNNEILDSYKSKISEYSSATELDKELAYELKKTNLEVFTKTPQYLPKDTPNTGIEAILAKYKK